MIKGGQMIDDKLREMLEETRHAAQMAIAFRDLTDPQRPYYMGQLMGVSTVYNAARVKPLRKMAIRFDTERPYNAGMKSVFDMAISYWEGSGE